MLVERELGAGRREHAVGTRAGNKARRELSQKARAALSKHSPKCEQNERVSRTWTKVVNTVITNTSVKCRREGHRRQATGPHDGLDGGGKNTKHAFPHAFERDLYRCPAVRAKIAPGERSLRKWPTRRSGAAQLGGQVRVLALALVLWV